MARTITITLYGSPCYMAEQNTMQNDINTPGAKTINFFEHVSVLNSQFVLRNGVTSYALAR